MLWVGLMSGTSADAIDAALVQLGSSARELSLLAFTSIELPENLRKRIHALVQTPVLVRDLVQLDVELGERFAAAVLAVLSEGGVAPERVAGIGSHGQTVGHFPEPEVRGSLQLGAPAVIHARTGIPVIADFRPADLAAGGQGAPLPGFFPHPYCALEEERRAVINIGGFTNGTHRAGSSLEAVPWVK
ncbi:MAG: anhydro-N-acetylmuramic acid kinase, partial [Deltaproteobacteria bacterium]|nr:anhydro-N-acetylmuramic acid kinase [Deltaproteobacteria bacterium]